MGPRTSPLSQQRTRLNLATIIILVLCPMAVAESFAPFVIPAQIDPQNAIWVDSYQPIQVDSARLSADDHFRRDGRRVRIWGVNLSFGANFPTHADAVRVATRLAAAGVDSVRCHHMDTSRWPRGIWNAQDGRTIEPEALDRLDFFINELAQRGIWVNINLHVGRAHSESLGLPETNRDYDKIAGIFTPALIEAQKQYATQLLTHVNPYRNVRYADDPAVAFVEITNEDSFFMWSAEDTLRTLPPYYAAILRDRYNLWLQHRYPSFGDLLTAWSQGTEPLGQTLLQNGDFSAAGTGVPQHWNIEQHEGCRATVVQRRRGLPDGTIQIQIDQADDTGWHIQLTQGGFALTKGRYYTVSFAASSTRQRAITCSVGQGHSPWGNLGLSRQVGLGETDSYFSFGFVATADDDNARISFALGGDDAPINLANVELQPGGQIALVEGESPTAGTVNLFQENESQPRILDRMTFLAETEKAYFDEMRRFIKNDLGCDALVTGTIVFGPLGLYGQSDMDFIDTHAYWQHPRFPGQPWDSGNWTIEQKPMTDYPQEATLFNLAAERLAGKPFTVSEYNHPAPLDAQAECVPMIAAFAAAQDWDGIWFYTYSHSGDSWDREVLSSYFDIDTNPAKWGFMRAGAAVFRDAALAPLASIRLASVVSSWDPLGNVAQLQLQYDRNMYGLLADRTGVTRDTMLNNVCIPTYTNAPTITSVSELPATTLTWTVQEQGTESKGLYSATGPHAQVYTGHADRFEEATGGNVRITSPEFVALTVTPLDDGGSLLVAACGRCENTGMQFSADRRTVGRNWGRAPVQIETVQGQLVLPEGQWTCHALAPDGTPKQRVLLSTSNGRSLLKLAPEHRTMWYLLERLDR